MFVTLVETWRDSRRQGDNMLLAAALPSLLMAVNVAGQRSLLDAARTLIDKVLCWTPFITFRTEYRLSPHRKLMRGADKVFTCGSLKDIWWCVQVLRVLPDCCIALTHIMAWTRPADRRTCMQAAALTLWACDCATGHVDAGHQACP